MKLSDSFAAIAKRVGWGLFSVFMLQPISAFSATSWKMVYVYKKPDGGHLMTSSRLKNSRYHLIKTYKTRKVVTPNKPKLRNGGSQKGSQADKVAHSTCNKIRMSTRASKYKRSIEVYSKIYGVSESLVRAIIKNESCYQANARSPVGAIGLMQLMPGTAKDMKISNPWNPDQNIQGGVKYIAEMLKEFNGNIRLAVAAYNAGPGNVRKYKGIPPFRETRTYVKRVMGDYQRLNQQYASLK